MDTTNETDPELWATEFNKYCNINNVAFEDVARWFRNAIQAGYVTGMRETMDRIVVPKTLEDMQVEVRQVNEQNGWFENSRTFGDDMALLHSEVSEMYEAYRQWLLEDVTNDVRPRGEDDELVGPQPKPEGVGSEAADILIRLLDTCDRNGIDLRAEYERKIAHNMTRGHRHGGKNV